VQIKVSKHSEVPTLQVWCVVFEGYVQAKFVAGLMVLCLSPQDVLQESSQQMSNNNDDKLLNWQQMI